MHAEDQGKIEDVQQYSNADQYLAATAWWQNNMNATHLQQHLLHNSK